MKAIVVALALTAMVFSIGITQSEAAQVAAKAQKNTGCGLGSTVVTDNDTLLGQLAMTFLNGIVGNQTFGITLGTSNCKKATKIVSIDTLNFVAGNMDTLARDMAMGEGEALDTLAELMEVPTAERTDFYATLQGNFSNIFTSETVQAADVIDNIAAFTS